MRRRLTTAVLAAAAPAAIAQPVDLAVQPGQSSVSARICLTPPGLSTRCDTDSSPVTGGISIELDSYVTPGAITIHDFTLALSNTMNYNMDWGPFVGGVNIQLSGVAVSYATPGTPTGPVAVDGTGEFSFPVVQAVITGAGAYQGYGLIMGPLIGSGSFNLADFGVVDSAIAGNVGISGDQVVLTGAQSFYNEGEINGVDASIEGNATLVALGDAPECIADFNGDGVVDTRDVLAFLNAWAAQDAASDCDGNGVVDTRDVICFLNSWNLGC